MMAFLPSLSSVVSTSTSELAGLSRSASSVLSSYKTKSTEGDNFLKVSLAFVCPDTISPMATLPQASLRLLHRSAQLMFNAPEICPRLKATNDRQSRRSIPEGWLRRPASSVGEMVRGAARAVRQSWQWSTAREAGDDDRPRGPATAAKLRLILSLSNTFSGTETDIDIESWWCELSGEEFPTYSRLVFWRLAKFFYRRFPSWARRRRLGSGEGNFAVGESKICCDFFTVSGVYSFIITMLLIETLT